jgi:hypothetical protein
LHDEHGRIVANSRRNAWVTCELRFKDRHREVMSPGKYTELFFLDEATALAAGHRPCATCRRQEFDEFKRLWLEANGSRIDLGPSKKVTMPMIDRVMADDRHAQLDGSRWSERLGSLPDGAMVVIDGRANLLKEEALWEWGFTGYSDKGAALPDKVVGVLTPISTVAVLALRYRPEVHSSAC